MDLNKINDKLIAAVIAAISGLVFWLLILVWGPSDPRLMALAVAIVALVAVLGLVLLYAWPDGFKPHGLAAIAVTAMVFALIALWVFWQLPAKGEVFRGDKTRIWTLVWGGIIALHILIPYLQIYSRSRMFRFPYSDLFRDSWNNTFIALIAWLFLGIFWGLLVLWANLFETIGIKFFMTVFFSKPFVSIVLPAAYGFGLALARDSQKIIITLRRITLTVFRALLPIMALIVLLFLVSLVFTGLQPLWDTRSASSLLLNVSILAILFINAVFQDGVIDRPYFTWLRRAVEAMIVVLPVIAILTLIAIGLRIDQYGLTPSRFYVVLFAGFGAIYSIAYAVAVFARAEVWMGLMRPVNIGMSVVVAGTAILIHTPVLDPLTWSARSQYQRLASGEADAKTFDYYFLLRKLGRAGNNRLEQLTQLKSHPQSEIINKKIADVRKYPYRYYGTRYAGIELKASDLRMIPPTMQLPVGLVPAMEKAIGKRKVKKCADNGLCTVFTLNMDKDPDQEYFLVLPYSRSSRYYELYLFDRVQGSPDWQRVAWYNIKHVRGEKRPTVEELLPYIRRRDLQPVKTEYYDLRIGDQYYYQRR